MGGPAILDGQADKALDFLNQLALYHANQADGAIVSDGGTTQASGANTAPNLDLDVSAIDQAVVDGTPLEPIAAAADVDSDAGDTVVWGATADVEITAAVVLIDGTPTYAIVPGAVAPTGESVAPTDEEVLAAVGAPSVRLANVVFERTGDTAITVAVDHSVRPGVFGFSSGFSTTEDEFKDTGAPRAISTALA